MGIWFPVIAAGIGTAVATFFQNRSWDHQQKETMQKGQLDAAMTFFNEFSVDTSTFFYSMRKLKNSIQNIEKVGDAAGIETNWTAFTTTMDKWYTNLNMNTGKLQMHFGKGTRDHFDEDVFPPLKKLKDLCFSIYPEKVEFGKSTRSDERQAVLDEFDTIYSDAGWKITEMSESMLGKINTWKVGMFSH